MSTMTGHDGPAMRASDADRDAVISDLGKHFQAGRLTAEELDERTGRALTAKTWGELTELSADLPIAPDSPIASPSSTASLPSPGHMAPPFMMGIGGLVVAALVLAVALGGWGLIWLIVPVLIIARRSARFVGAPGHED
jgi:hypothetical protein